MPIIFYSVSGQKEQAITTQNTASHAVIVWHEETLRFVVIELTSKLYGFDISSYAKSISSQLKTIIPQFDQLVSWCEKIDPRAVQARVLVGQLIKQNEDYQLQLQASDEQVIWMLHNQEVFKLDVNQLGITGTFLPGDQIIIGCQNALSNIGKNDVILQKNLEITFGDILSKYTEESKILIISNQKKKAKLSQWFKNIHFPKQNNTKIEKELKPNQTLVLSRSVKIDSKRRITLGFALLFLLLLIISVGFGIQKRNQLAQNQQQQQLISDVTYRLEQAKSLQDLNPARAKILLSEARQALSEYYLSNKLTPQSIKDLEREVALSYEKVSGLILVQDAVLYYDPTLLKDGFSPSQMSLSDAELALLDPINRIVATLTLQSKAAKLVGGINQVNQNSRLASIPAWTFLLSGPKLAIIDKQTQKQIKSFTLANTSVSDMVGYGNNLYVLDVPAGQALRFRGVKDGLSKSEEFFSEKQDLTGAVSMAVDGSVWILYGNGAVEKYTSGVRDALFTDFGLDKPLQKPSQIFTDENQKYLYLLDKNQGRIITISKQGEFKAEYNWEGLKTCDKFVVNEQVEKILVLKDGKIWGISLK